MNHKLQVTKYVIADFFSATLTWLLFFTFRRTYIDPLSIGYIAPVLPDKNLYYGLIFIPVFWIFLYYLTGYYTDVNRKSRLNDIGQTLLHSIIGCTVIFFLLLLDDVVDSYKNYYLLYSALFVLHFIVTLIPRYILTYLTARKVHQRKFGFNTIIIGSNELATDIYNELEKQPKSTGNKIIGFVYIKNGNGYHEIEKHIPNLGNSGNLREIIESTNTEEVIIAIEPGEHDQISHILNSLANGKVIIKAIPSLSDILSGKVKLTQIFGTPLIELTHEVMPVWQANTKQLLDILISILALIVLSPLILYLAVRVKLSSPGPVIYSHERIGRHGKPFRIYKFRSMYMDSEKNGPELSSKDDVRLTDFGRFMRKYRLDEIPNFINVIKGEMSLVGPRPERQYFIDKISKVAPHCVHLQKVKPGITSWGQVKYGYAENIDQMVRRLQYDILYIENMSLLMDLKILFYTVVTILKGRGI